MKEQTPIEVLNDRARAACMGVIIFVFFYMVGIGLHDGVAMMVHKGNVPAPQTPEPLVRYVRSELPVAKVVNDPDPFGKPVSGEGCLHLWSFGGTAYGKVGFLLPSNLAGNYCLMTAEGKKQWALAYVDDKTGSIIIETNEIRIGVHRQ